MKIFGREPTVYVTIVGAVLGYLVMLGLDGLSDLQAAAIMGVLMAIVAAVNGFLVKPFNPAFANGLIAAVAGLLLAYSVQISPEQVNALQAIAVAIGGLFAVRVQVTPKHDAVPISPETGRIR